MSRPEEQEISSVLPASRPTGMEHYQKAPTLMAGETPGIQGQVQVWAPDKHRIQLQLAGWVGATGAAAAFLLMLHSAGFWSWLLLALPLWLAVVVGLLPAVGAAVAAFYAANVLMALPALWKPSYVTADEVGMGVTTWKGSRAIPWSELITYARYRILHYVLLYTESGETLLINTSGYPRKAMDEFCEIAAERAHLEVHDRSRWRRILFAGSYSGRFRKGYRLAFTDQVVREKPALQKAGPEKRG